MIPFIETLRREKVSPREIYQSPYRATSPKVSICFIGPLNNKENKWAAEIDREIVARFEGSPENIQEQKTQFLREKGIIFD